MSGANTVASCSLAIVAFMAASLSATTASTVPAMYVFGDSLADVGNNNYLLTVLRADFPHNGMDYQGGKATGRFSNGKNSADFLAEKLGLATSPPYLALSSSGNANGVSFASGGAGVSNTTNKDLCITMDKQIEYYAAVYASLAQSLGQGQAARHLAKSIFAITIGSNDIINYAKADAANTQLITNPSQQFVDALVQTLAGQLQSLYNLGARKVLFLGLGPVGCCPSLRELSPARDCSAEANAMAARYNEAAGAVLGGMSARHPDLRYALFDASAALRRYLDRPAEYGFAEVRAACCGLGDLNAKVACTPLSDYCANRSDHLFWDFFHPTEATAEKLVGTAFDGSAPYVFPINLRQLSAM